MTVYAVDRICRDVLRDKNFREAMRADPHAALAARDLTEEERSALLAGDVARLHRLGANDFLMGYLARFEVLGLNIKTFAERIRTARE
jgi:hypothetical protein